MYRLFLKPEAEKDVLQAALWYDSRQKGLGERFVDDAEELFTYIERNPSLFPEKYPPVFH